MRDEIEKCLDTMMEVITGRELHHNGIIVTVVTTPGPLLTRGRVTRDRERAGTGSSGQSRGWSSHTQSQCEGVCSILHLVKLICDQEKYLMTHSCALLSSSSACGRGTRGKPGIRPA